MNTLWFSLRRRLLGLLLGGVSVAWGVTMVFSYVDAHHEVDELFDAQLAQAGQTLLVLADQGGGRAVSRMEEAVHKYQRRLRFQIWDADGQLVMRSETAGTAPLTPIDGFSETEDGAGHWRHFSQWNSARRLQVQVSEDHRIRDDLIAHIAWRIVLPALFGLPLLGLGVWLATRRGLASLDVVAGQIASRAPEQLQAVSPASAPEEIRPMLEALNGLFRRVDSALEAERRFTADAAHELRTPLAALQTQLQVALRARDDAERARSLAQIQSGLARAAHLVEQMLQLARLDPESGLPDPRAVDLAALAEDVCAELGSAILARGLEFELAAEPGCVVFGQAEWLRVLLRNLLDNALRYTPEGGRLRVGVARAAEGPGGAAIVLGVEDDGPGIPPGQRESVLARFVRLEAGSAPGSGLGLAIVARIVDLHGARLALGSGAGGRGLRVEVRWPAPAPTG